ncbi:MAG: T9SS type A sorting domain-containing protein [Bacteroidota bacterium]
MRTIIFTSLFLASLLSLQAQSLSRQVIGTAGSDNPQLSYTVGETVIQTAVSGSFILTQGFQQPDQLAVNNEKTIQVSVDYKLYPNPSHDWMVLELSSTKDLDLKIDIVDMAGRLVEKDQGMKVSGTASQQFDVSNFAAGSYLLRIKTSTGQAVKTLKFERLD